MKFDLDYLWLFLAIVDVGLFFLFKEKLFLYIAGILLIVFIVSAVRKSSKKFDEKESIKVRDYPPDPDSDEELKLAEQMVDGIA